MAEQVVLPDGQEFFKLNEVCKVANVQPYMLRFWGTEFAQLEAAKSGTGQRLYSKEQVQVILEIRRLLFDEGLTIAGARKRVGAMQKEGDLPVPEIPVVFDGLPVESSKAPAKSTAKTKKTAKPKKATAKKPDAEPAEDAAESVPVPAKASEPEPESVAAAPSPEEIEKAAARRVKPLLSTLKDVRKEVVKIMADLKNLPTK